MSSEHAASPSDYADADAIESAALLATAALSAQEAAQAERDWQLQQQQQQQQQTLSTDAIDASAGQDEPPAASAGDDLQQQRQQQLQHTHDDNSVVEEPKIDEQQVAEWMAQSAEQQDEHVRWEGQDAAAGEVPIHDAEAIQQQIQQSEQEQEEQHQQQHPEVNGHHHPDQHQQAAGVSSHHHHDGYPPSHPSSSLASTPQHPAGTAESSSASSYGHHASSQHSASHYASLPPASSVEHSSSHYQPSYSYYPPHYPPSHGAPVGYPPASTHSTPTTTVAGFYGQIQPHAYGAPQPSAYQAYIPPPYPITGFRPSGGISVPALPHLSAPSASSSANSQDAHAAHSASSSHAAAHASSSQHYGASAEVNSDKATATDQKDAGLVDNTQAYLQHDQAQAAGGLVDYTNSHQQHAHQAPLLQQYVEGVPFETKKRKRTIGSDANKEKRHICPHCERGFARAYNLKTHIQTHAADPPKPFMCPHDSCGNKAFSRSHDLARHKGSVHGEGGASAKQAPKKKRLSTTTPMTVNQDGASPIGGSSRKSIEGEDVSAADDAAEQAAVAAVAAEHAAATGGLTQSEYEAAGLLLPDDPYAQAAADIASGAGAVEGEYGQVEYGQPTAGGDEAYAAHQPVAESELQIPGVDDAEIGSVEASDLLAAAAAAAQREIEAAGVEGAAATAVDEGHQQQQYQEAAGSEVQQQS